MKFNTSRVQKLIWVIGLSIVSMVVVFAVGTIWHSSDKLYKITVKTHNNAENVIDVKEIEKLINKTIKDSQLKNTKLNLTKIETIVNAHPLVEKGEVYLDSNEKLNIVVTQKMPKLRVIDNEGIQFFIDKIGEKCPVGSHLVSRCRILSGALPSYTDGMVFKDSTIYQQAWALDEMISNNEFLEALIEEIHVDREQNLVLIPKMGVERIIFGSFDEDADIKCKRLVKFYKSVIASQKGTHCVYLNLTAKNQVICGTDLVVNNELNNISQQ